jgi:hypothetical protein
VGTAVRKKIPDEIPATAMRAQPHGGALKTGGPNRGAGRPPSVLREMARAITAEALPQVRLVALGERITVTRKVKDDDEGDVYADFDVRPEIRDRMEAFDRLSALGMGEEIRSEDVRKRLEHQAEIIVATLGAEDAARVLAAIGEAWQ